MEKRIIDSFKDKKFTLYRLLRFTNESLIKAKTNHLEGEKKIKELLDTRSFADVEKEYIDNEKELQQLSDDLEKCEPVKVKNVTDEDIQAAMKKETKIALDIQRKQNDRDILLSIKEPAGLPKAEIPPFPEELKPPHEIKDEMQNLITRLSEIRKQKEQIHPESIH